MRTATRRAAEGVLLAGGIALLRPRTRGVKWARRGLDQTSRRLRFLSGRLDGLSYRMRGRRPDPGVIDNVLADRIRSSLGGLEKRLDLPRVHVMVEHHVALLHGEVASPDDAEEIERAVAAVSGVEGVESYLHVGLATGDSRPSEGRAVHPPSAALQELLAAATGTGVPEEAAEAVVHGVLATFADRLPADERDQVAVHLPADVRLLFRPPRRTLRAAPARTVHELVARIAETTADLPPERATEVTEAIVTVLRGLVPDEAAGVAAVLPEELRGLWNQSTT